MGCKDKSLRTVARKILKKRKVRKHALTGPQKRFFGWQAGSAGSRK